MPFFLPDWIMNPSKLNFGRTSPVSRAGSVFKGQKFPFFLRKSFSDIETVADLHVAVRHHGVKVG